MSMPLISPMAASAMGCQTSTLKPTSFQSTRVPQPLSATGQTRLSFNHLPTEGAPHFEGGLPRMSRTSKWMITAIIAALAAVFGFADVVQAPARSFFSTYLPSVPGQPLDKAQQNQE